MNQAMRRVAANPMGAALPALALFALLMVLLGQDVGMALVACVVGALGLIILAKPEFGVQLLILHTVASFSTFFEMPRVGPISAVLALEGVLVLAFFVQFSFRGQRFYFNLAECWLLVGYLVAMMFSFVLADYFGPENVFAFRQNILIKLLIFFLALNLLTTWGSFLRSLGVLLLADLVLVVSGLLNHAGLLDPRRIDPTKIEGRTVGIIGNPNGMAFTLIGLLPFLIGLIFYVRRPYQRVLLFGAVVLNLFVILGTLSRGGFISIIALMGFMSFRLAKDRRLVALVLVFGLITYLLLPAALFERFNEVRSLKGNSRYVLTMIGLTMALDNPVFGVGYGNFERYFPKYDIFNRGGATAPHNMYTSLASQTGIPSLILYLVMIALAWRRLGMLLKHFMARGDRFRSLVTIALQANLLNLLVFGLTSHLEHEILVFVTLALTLVLHRLTLEDEASAAAQSAAPLSHASIGTAAP